MIIEIVSSSPHDLSPSSALSSVEERVDEALGALVKHYSDPIHIIDNSCIPKTLSYFGNPAEYPIPPVIRHWLDRLTKDSPPPRGTSNNDTLLVHALHGYTRWIRPTLIPPESIFASSNPTVTETGVPVLQHYELLLSYLMLEFGNSLNVENTNAETTRKETDAIVTIAEYDQEGSFCRPLIETESLSILASDISFMTRVAVFMKDKEMEQKTARNALDAPSISFQVANIILPTMIRIATHFVDVIYQFTSRATPNSKQAVISSVKNHIQKCAVVMLAFGCAKMDPRDVDPSLEQSLLRVYSDQFFLYLPNLSPRNHDHHNETSSILSLGSHLTDENFWAQLRLNGSAWEDLDTGIVSLVVKEFWGNLYRHRGILAPVERTCTGVAQSARRDISDAKDNNSPSLARVIRDCLRELSSCNGKAALSKSIRAHFFGRDLASVAEDRLSTITTTTTRLHLGRTTTVPNDDREKADDVKAFLNTPSRVHVVMHYLSLLERDDLFAVQDLSAGDDNRSASFMLEELLPIIYELLSATASSHIGMGASALIRLLGMTLPTEDEKKVSITGHEEILAAKRDEFLFDEFTGSLLPVLDLACKTCREGPAFVFLSRAQSMLCYASFMFHQKNGDRLINRSVFVKHRRATTREFLTVLSKHNHKVSDPDNLLWALLVGGIIPLLHQHATVPEAIGNVDAMEIGRLGLKALLPILRYSGGWCTSDMLAEEAPLWKYNSSRKLLAPVVLALVHLLHAAYPIMPRHGGKIMSELLGLLGDLQRQNLSKIDPSLMNLVKDAAGLALAICGERADQTLTDVATTNDDGEYIFEACLVDYVAELRRRAELWIEAQPFRTCT